MRFLLDENVPFELREALRARDWTVVHVADAAPETTDLDVLAWAVREEFILVTFDSDFGALIFYEQRAAPIGLIYLQAPSNGAALAVAHLVSALDDNRLSLPDRYTVIDHKGSVRVLPLR